MMMLVLFIWYLFVCYLFQELSGQTEDNKDKYYSVIFVKIVL